MVTLSNAGTSGPFSCKFEPERVYACCVSVTIPKTAAASRARMGLLNAEPKDVMSTLPEPEESPSRYTG